MDYKEKYEQMIERAKRFSKRLECIQSTDSELALKELKDIFPELKESDDEKIRKKLLSSFKGIMADADEDELWYGLPYNDIISWLEKQSYKPLNDTDEDIVEAVKNISTLDLVGPKFHIGDYLVNDYCKGKVIELTDDAYLLDTEQGIPFSCEHNAHLWTIKDAKDGDVLAAYEHIVLFKEIDGLNIKCHCAYKFTNSSSFYVNTLQNKTAFHPATKEQSDLLFQKIKEAGYEWDADKKELKKIITPFF